MAREKVAQGQATGLEERVVTRPLLATPLQPLSQADGHRECHQ